jgi:hypothetical protein
MAYISIIWWYNHVSLSVSSLCTEIVPVGIIAGGTVGSSILLLIFLLALAFFLYRQRKGSEYCTNQLPRPLHAASLCVCMSVCHSYRTCRENHLIPFIVYYFCSGCHLIQAICLSLNRCVLLYMFVCVCACMRTCLRLCLTAASVLFGFQVDVGSLWGSQTSRWRRSTRRHTVWRRSQGAFPRQHAWSRPCTL